jgi:hypothetical protein
MKINKWADIFDCCPGLDPGFGHSGIGMTDKDKNVYKVILS